MDFEYNDDPFFPFDNYSNSASASSSNWLCTQPPHPYDYHYDSRTFDVNDARTRPYNNDSRMPFINESRTFFINDSRTPYINNSRMSYANNSKTSYADDSRTFFINDSKTFYADNSRAFYADNSRPFYADNSRSPYTDNSRTSYASNSKTSFINDLRIPVINESRIPSIINSRISSINTSKVNRQSYGSGRYRGSYSGNFRKGNRWRHFSKQQGSDLWDNDPLKQKVAQLEKKFIQLGNLLKDVNIHEKERMVSGDTLITDTLNTDICDFFNSCCKKVNMAVGCASRSRMSQNGQKKIFIYELSLNSIWLSSAEDELEKKSKIKAYDIAFNKLTKPFLKIKCSGKSHFSLISSELQGKISRRELRRIEKRKLISLCETYLKLSKQDDFSQFFNLSTDSIENFKIVGKKYIKISQLFNPIKKLKYSAKFNDIILDLKKDSLEKSGKMFHRCSVILDGKVIGEALADSQEQAEYNVCRLVVEKFKPLTDEEEDLSTDNEGNANHNSSNDNQNNRLSTIDMPSIFSESNSTKAEKKMEKLGNWLRERVAFKQARITKELKLIFSKTFFKKRNDIILKKFLDLGISPGKKKYSPSEMKSELEIYGLLHKCCRNNHMKLSYQINKVPPRKNWPLILNCKLMCDNICLSIVGSNTEQISKAKAYGLAFIKLTRPFKKIVKNSRGLCQLKASDFPFKEEKKGKLKKHILRYHKVFEDFIVIEYCSETTPFKPLRIIEESALFNKATFKYSFNHIDGNIYRCIMELNGKKVGQSIGTTEESLCKAAIHVLNSLKSHKPVVSIGCQIDEEIIENKEAIEDSSVDVVMVEKTDNNKDSAIDDLIVENANINEVPMAAQSTKDNKNPTVDKIAESAENKDLTVCEIVESTENNKNLIIENVEDTKDLLVDDKIIDNKDPSVSIENLENKSPSFVKPIYHKKITYLKKRFVTPMGLDDIPVILSIYAQGTDSEVLVFTGEFANSQRKAITVFASNFDLKHIVVDECNSCFIIVGRKQFFISQVEM